MTIRIPLDPHAIRNALQGAAVALAVGTSSLSTPGIAQASPAVRTIEIAKTSFHPQEITVPRGTKIVWTNHDEMPHTVTSRNKTFASKGLDTDDKYEYTFDRDGDFEYYCTVHPYMTGTVHVRK